MVTVIVEEKTPEQRLDDIELELHGTGEEGADPGLLELVNTQVMGVLGHHEKRLRALEPPVGMVRDWFSVTDPEVAAKWLEDLDQWRDRVFNYLAPGLLDKKPCLLWHPAVVGRLITLHGLWVVSHKGRIFDVAMVWDRYVGSFRDKIREEIEGCKPEMHKGHDCGHRYEVPGRRGLVENWKVDELGGDALVGDYLKWWCGTRQGRPPGLMPL